MTEKMKPSGIVWIGNIPNEWECKQIAFMTDSRSGGTPDRNNLTYWENGTIPWMSSGEVNKVNVYETDEKITELATRNSSAKIVKANAVMVALNGQGKTKGMSAILRIDSACNQSLCAFSCYEGVLHYEYLYWCFQTMYTYLRQMSGDDVRDGLAASYVKKQKIPVPEYQEQCAIADFLDAQCAKIDSVIADIEKQIETLQKYKKSLITETVTKGCTAGSKTKTARLDFADEINEAWIETRVKYLCSMYSGDNLTSSDIEPEGDYPVYGGNGLRGFYAAYTNDGEHVLIGRQGALCGNVHLVSGKFWATDHAVVTYPYEGMCNGYLFYLFSAMNLNQYSQTAAQPGLAVAAIQNLNTCIPPTTVIQQEIAKYLDEKCGKIDSIIKAKRKQLEIMEEHKKSLIYEYVTGKKRVTEVN